MPRKSKREKERSAEQQEARNVSVPTLLPNQILELGIIKTQNKMLKKKKPSSNSEYVWWTKKSNLQRISFKLVI